MASADPVPLPIVFRVAGPRATAAAGSPAPAPLWIARAQLLGWTTPADSDPIPWLNAAARNLFVKWPSVPATSTMSLRPGLVIAQCRIFSVHVRLGESDYRLSGVDDSVFVDALLLLEADPDRWALVGDGILAPGPIDSGDGAFRCVEGEISTEDFPLINGQARPTMSPWTTQFPMLSDVTNLRVNSSGLAAEGRAVFPWMPGPISSARYLAEVQLTSPPGPPGPPAPLLVLVDRFALNGNKAATNDLIGAFMRACRPC